MNTIERPWIVVAWDDGEEYFCNPLHSIKTNFERFDEAVKFSLKVGYYDNVKVMNIIDYLEKL